MTTLIQALHWLVIIQLGLMLVSTVMVFFSRNGKHKPLAFWSSISKAGLYLWGTVVALLSISIAYLIGDSLFSYCLFFGILLINFTIDALFLYFDDQKDYGWLLIVSIAIPILSLVAFFFLLWT